jgi:hypothetical protein
MPFGIPKGAICVQRFDDSLNSAIRITYRISLRSSSMPEPRDPLLKVFYNLILGLRHHSLTQNLGKAPGRHESGAVVPPAAPKDRPAKATWYNKQRVGGRAIKALTR